MERKSIEIQGRDIPVIEVNTLVVGSGAAALKCADRLDELGVKNIALVTEFLGGGTSNNSGSDKQTYYKLGVGSRTPDSPYLMAEDLFSGGSMHGDLALVEALGSLESFYHLVAIGVPFPKNRFGGFTGYKTDHDPRQRATSAGPYTSMQMFRCLLSEVRRREIPVFDRHQVISLLADGSRVTGAVVLDLDSFDAAASRGAVNPAKHLVLFMAENLVFGTGGPGGLYERSVYPEGHTGAIGLALEAGAAAANLTESQYGLASIKFRWNVSGTYQQVVPAYYSTDENGNDRRFFLNDFFPDPGRLGTAVFLKGYQWPFDPRKVRDYGSSLIDILVYRETVQKGRRVFMDFRSNPRGDERIGDFRLDSLEPEAYSYLEKSGALLETPIQRLAHMNPLAIELYRKHGIDLHTEPLEIAVCAQHNNGGLAGDIWWESVNLAHLFPVGEVNGSHGVYRPGGSALNSGQVGALRAAEKIANAYSRITLTFEDFSASAKARTEELLSLMRSFLTPDGNDETADRERSLLQQRMTREASHIRSLPGIEQALKEGRKQLADFSASVRVRDSRLLPHLMVTRHLLVAHVAYLSALYSALERGVGSRGSCLVMSPGGEEFHPDLEAQWRMIPEDTRFREEVLMTRLSGGAFRMEEVRNEFVRRREVPGDEFWFETVWSEYLKKSLYY